MLLASCIKDPPEAITKLIIANDSNHFIEGVVYLKGNEYSHFTLNPSKFYEIENNGGNGGNFMFQPFDTADSLIITFDNQYSVTHYRNSNQNYVSRNIFMLSNWNKIKEMKYYFEYKYELSDDDYLEAVNNQQ